MHQCIGGEEREEKSLCIRLRRPRPPPALFYDIYLEGSLSYARPHTVLDSRGRSRMGGWMDGRQAGREGGALRLATHGWAGGRRGRSVGRPPI